MIRWAQLNLTFSTVTANLEPKLVRVASLRKKELGSVRGGMGMKKECGVWYSKKGRVGRVLW